MSDKAFGGLMTLDQALRRKYPVRDFEPNYVDPFTVTIEKINGFELFNTRPYHNYECWADGYRVIFQEKGKEEARLVIEREDLDVALHVLAEKISNYQPKE